MAMIDEIRRMLVVSISKRGSEVASRISTVMRSRGHIVDAFCRYHVDGCDILSDPVKVFLADNLRRYDAAVLVMSLPGFYRISADLMIEKNHDVPVVVVDDAGRFAVAASAGHAGGSDELAAYIAGIIDGQAVITDGIESGGRVSVEKIARSLLATIANPECIIPVNAAIANGEHVPVIFRSKKRSMLRRLFAESSDEKHGYAIVLADEPGEDANTCYLIPDDISIGIGFNSSADAELISACLERFLEEAGLAWEDIDYVSSIKDLPDVSIIRKGTRFVKFDPADIRDIDPEMLTHVSDKARDVFGVPGVAEPCAIRSLGPGSKIFLPFRSCGRSVTLAAARRRKLFSGHISFIGVGPSDPDLMTMKARRAIVASDIVAGYQMPLDIAKSMLWNKPKVVFHWKEQQRYVDEVIDLYEKGYRIAYLFTGDSCFTESELIRRFTSKCRNFDIIPGISSVQAASSITGMAIEMAGIISFHVTGDIEDRKADLLRTISERKRAIIIPRPYDFMPKDIAKFLTDRGFGDLPAVVIERATAADERRTASFLKDLIGSDFSDISIMVVGKPVIA
ncbi:precorrin-6y C5,15-methyltransferase (decarboxylating) subunit CbiE [Thermoplasma acidophilum]|nr:precorrin-6y C5,15-methyltransferase (decarboxylating) subunit CbiE [Thermoplasma acidophilum]